MFYIAFVAAALFGMFLFGGSKVICIILLLAALVGAVLRLAGKGKMYTYSVYGIPLCLLLCLFAGQSTEGGLVEYGGQLQEIAAKIDRGKLDEGLELLDALDENYGITDLSCYARAEIYLTLEEYGTVSSCLKAVVDKSSVNWYEYMERLYKGQGTEDALARLKDLYLSAAETLSANSRMQYMAGLVKLNNGAYQAAAYYFQRARELDEKDAASCYYLGVLCYEQGRREEAAGYFEEALQRGLDEEKAANIQWYRE